MARVELERVSGDLRRMTLRGGDLVVSILPELGGKIDRLSRDGGPNLLLEPPEVPPREATFGAAFEDYDTSGWDECFPSVGVAGDVPDHGELWSVPWEVYQDGDGILCEVRGSVTPCLFRRRLALANRTLRLEYEIVSEADRDVDVVWSAHPLLRASPGSEIVLPRSVDALTVEWSLGDRLGRHGDTTRQVPAVLAPSSAGTADKLFTARLDEGRCAYLDRATGEALAFRWDAARVPYLGLWICQGGWPTSRPAKHYTVALEPCLAPCDSLAEARAGGQALRLAPRARYAFALDVTLGRPS
jgi:hypothetical protein